MLGLDCMHCAVCIVQCALCSVQCAAVWSVQCGVCSGQWALCSVKCAVCSVQCATVQSVMCSMQCVISFTASELNCDGMRAVRNNSFHIHSCCVPSFVFFSRNGAENYLG